MAHPLIEKARAAYAQTKTDFKKYRNQDFLAAALAAAALVTVADGTIDKDEKKKTLLFVRDMEALQVFDLDDVQKQFKQQLDDLDPMDGEVDSDMAGITAMQRIGKLKGHTEQAEMVVQLAIIIGGADGDFDEDEQKVTSKIAKKMGLDPTDFDLPA